MTRGEYRVGINFNSSGDSLVGRLKSAAAAFIDLVEEIPAESMHPQHDAEVKRLKALAQTAIEESAMWAVKAATKPPVA